MIILIQALPPIPPVPSVPLDPNLVASHLNPGAAVMIVALIMGALTVVFWPLARALARRLEGRPTLTPALQNELEQLHHHLAEVDLLQQRVAELEERLDFAERLLARGESQSTLPRSAP
jgi:hypothetical protein